MAEEAPPLTKTQLSPVPDGSKASRVRKGTTTYRTEKKRRSHTGLVFMAIFLVTGREVFHADSALAVAVKHVQEQPDPPSAHSELPIPAEFDELVMGCLAKKRGERIQSVVELLELLRSVPGDPWTADRAWSWWEKNAPEVSGHSDPG